MGKGDHMMEKGDSMMEKKDDTIDEGIGGSGEESANEASKEADEPQEMTLSEYKALQKAKRTRPEFNKRQAGEGENKEQWKNSYALENKKEKLAEKRERKQKDEDASDEE